ncbi:hypothetical protein SFRURICE_013975 [Spodoptera frugiperda]|nr:hypothetical protein SFRURICE_013975 [Spodoptera frugiperda]
MTLALVLFGSPLLLDSSGESRIVSFKLTSNVWVLLISPRRRQLVHYCLALLESGSSGEEEPFVKTEQRRAWSRVESEAVCQFPSPRKTRQMFWSSEGALLVKMQAPFAIHVPTPSSSRRREQHTNNSWDTWILNHNLQSGWNHSVFCSLPRYTSR